MTPTLTLTLIKLNSHPQHNPKRDPDANPNPNRDPNPNRNSNLLTPILEFEVRSAANHLQIRMEDDNRALERENIALKTRLSLET